jgi:hypothetical protein
MTTTLTEPATDLDSKKLATGLLADIERELIPTIDPTKLTLADWKLIAEVQEYRIAWVYKIWIKAKGSQFLKSIGIDHWLRFAEFLGYKSNWATERYMEYKNIPSSDKE